MVVGCCVVVGEPVVVGAVVVGESPDELLPVVRLVVVVSGWPVVGWFVVGAAVLVSLDSVVVLGCSRSNSTVFVGAEVLVASDVLVASEVLPFTRFRFSTRP